MRSIGGTIANVSIAERHSPPITTDPSPLYSSDPAPGKTTNGTIPKNTSQC